LWDQRLCILISANFEFNVPLYVDAEKEIINELDLFGLRHATFADQF